MKKILKSVSKNIVPSPSFWKSLFACDYSTRKTLNRDAQKSFYVPWENQKSNMAAILRLFFAC